MNKSNATTPKVHPARWTCRLLFVCGAFVLAGCSLLENNIPDDPLRGGYGQPIPSNASTTTGARGVSDGTAAGALPPVDGPTSPAALTNAGGVLGNGPARADGTAGVGVTVGGPRTASSRLTPVAATNDGPATTQGPRAAAPPATPVTSAAGEYEQLQQMLLARGVTWQQLKTGTARDEWVFVCSVPNPRDKNLEREYEATAVGPFGLAAIRAVIKRIDDDSSVK
jgi:hypothetical protein